MGKQPKVSVILTSYNHAKYLREAIDSVLDQTFSDFELLIVDDASTDESWQIIQSYTDPRIQAFRSEANTKAGGDGRRVISEVARGEYIAMDHSDDVWEPQKLEKQVAFLGENPNIGAVFSHATIINENGNPFEEKNHFYYKIFDQPNRSRYEWLNYFFYHGNALCHPSVLIRKECYQDRGVYRYGLAQIADFDMWVRLCLKYEIYVLPEKLVRFRVRSHDMNASADRVEARKRGQFEFFEMYASYRAIRSPEELIRIFPSAEKYFRQEDYDLGFALGMMALETEAFNAAKLFGLDLLFEAINDPERARKIDELYHFKNSDFIALTGKQDAFSIGSIASLNQDVAERDGQIADLQEDISSLSMTLDGIYSSRIWHTLAPLRWYGAQKQRARRLISSLPAFVSRPGGIPATLRNVWDIWRHNGWAAVESAALQSMDVIEETEPASPVLSDDLELLQIKSQRPEILFISHEATRTGAPIFLLGLMRFLAPRLDLGFVILLRNGGELTGEFSKLGVTVVNSTRYGLDPLILHALKKRNIKLIYSNTITNGALQIQLKQLGCPILCHVHELAFSIEAFYRQKSLRQFLASTTTFLAGSEAVASDLQDKLRVPRERIVVAHSFISTRANLEAVANISPPLHPSKNTVVIGACGTIGWRKGTDIFLQVARRVLSKTRQPVLFVWVGGPVSRGEHINLRYDARLMGIDNHVIFTGITTSHLSYFAQFDIFTLTSREDPFPLVALDAASFGIPIICFDQAGGTPELVEQDAGFVVPYLDMDRMAEAVLQLIENKALRKQQGERARQKVVERYDTAVGGEHILKIIKSFL